MIRVKLSQEDMEKLESLRFQASGKESEKALMVLLSNDGLSPPEIAKRLKRNPHTVRDWLKRYQKLGVEGLQRHYSPGRPPEKRESVIQTVLRILKTSPEEYGYKEYLWNVPLIAHYLQNSCDLSASDDTIERALKDCGFTYKRPSKTVSPKAPDPEAKKAAIDEMVQEIKGLLSGGEWEIFALDESHFSTEPYLVKGWIKKRWPPEDSWGGETRKRHDLWCIESRNTKILLEKVSKF